MLPFIAHSILDVFTYWWPFPLLKYIILFVIKEEKLSTEKKKKNISLFSGGGQEIVNDPVDSEPCHFYCMSARKCCSLTKQVHNDIFFKDGLLNKKFVVIQYSLCNLFLVGGVFLTVIPLS